MTPAPPTVTSALPRALVVGAGPDALSALGPALGAERFQVDFIGRTDTPYISIRRRRPDLVVLCGLADADDACRVMAALQFDPATRHVRVVTCMAGEAYAIIPTRWPATSGIPSESRFSAPCRAR